MIAQVKTSTGIYPIIFENGGLKKAGRHFHLNRKALVVTDAGVPESYAKGLLSMCREGVLFTLPQGEEAKSLYYFEQLQKTMLEHSFTRKDCVVAVGGGVVGDAAGFAAACYMRGIDFYNVPTTVLSQVDSSIGGKTAVNLEGVKNIVGCFYPPKRVLIDGELLQTLAKRQVSNGYAEIIKIALTRDADLFEMLEELPAFEKMDEAIRRAVLLKQEVVEQDEREQSLRKVLNFGHTLGHGIEALQGKGGLYHGECVALGMLPMCSPDVRARLKKVLEKYKLPTHIKVNSEAVIDKVMHDKKREGDAISVVYCHKAGDFSFEQKTREQLLSSLQILEEEA